METEFTCAPVSCLEVEHCRWPVSDHPYMFCNNQRTEDVKNPYCPYHSKLAYQPRAVTKRGNQRNGRLW